MKVYSTSTQWAVGQGFFHSGTVLARRSGRRAEYVYDCGSLPRYKDSLRREIDAFVQRLDGRKHVDLLFLSHFHLDHVSGLSDLLGQCSVGRVVAPLLLPVERLLAFAMALDQAPEGDWPEWYPSLIANPVATMAQFVPDDQVVWVAVPDEAANIVPPLLGLYEESSDQADANTADFDLAEQLKLPVPGRAVPASDAGATMTNGLPDSQVVWIWTPWVQPALTAQTSAFRHDLISRLPGHLANLDDADVLTEIVTQHQAELRAAYVVALSGGVSPQDLTKHGLNLTSLSLYSGPAVSNSRSWRVRRIDGESVAERAEVLAWGVRAGWLGTGDGALKEGDRAASFNAFFRHLKEEVGIFAIPHHGSARNWCPSLLDDFAAPPVCVVGADHVGNWRHPSHEVAQSVNARGSVMVVATSAKESRWTDAAMTKFGRTKGL